MRIAMWVLIGIGAFVLLGTVVLPLLGWLLHALAWVAAGALVIGGGLVVAHKLSEKRRPKGELTDSSS